MKAIIKATTGTQIGLPWENGVAVSLLGEPTLDNIIKELNEIKKMINADANKAGLALNQLTITIDKFEL